MVVWAIAGAVAAILLVAGAERLHRSRAMRRSRARWVSGRLRAIPDSVSWLGSSPLGWFDRSVHVELRPRPGRAVVDVRFKEVDRIARERSEIVTLELDDGTCELTLDGELDVEGAEELQQLAGGIDALPSLARSAIAPNGKTLDAYQQLRVVERRVAPGTLVSARVEAHRGADGAEQLTVRELFVGTAASMSRSVRVQGMWLIAAGVVLAALAAAALAWKL